MPRNGSGSYSLPPVYLATPGTTVRSEQHNVPLQDIAQALSDSLPRNGSAPMTGNLPMGGRRITGLGAATANGDAVRFEQAVLTTNTQAYGRSLLNTASASAARALLEAVPTFRTVSPGAGLTGGGPLSANVTVSMGTPSSITSTSTNETTSTSHTHLLTNATVRTIYSNSNSGEVGTYALMGRSTNNTQLDQGIVVDGDTIRYAGVAAFGSSLDRIRVTLGGTSTGRWKCMGILPVTEGGDATRAVFTQFLRIE